MSQYPMNDLRNPLGKAFYDLTQQVEALGGSPELTAVVVAIGALRDQVGAVISAAQERAKGVPTEVGIAWQSGTTWPNERKAVTVDGNTWYRHDHPKLLAAQERAEPVAPAVGEVNMEAFDDAVETELMRVSTVPYNSHDICRWFAANVRGRLSATPPAPAQPAQAEPSMRERLQKQCSAWGTYWRASDAHGVELSLPQAVELLEDALGVEVEIKHNGCTTCDGSGMIGGPSYYSPDEGGVPCPDCAAPVAQPSPEPSKPEQAEAPSDVLAYLDGLKDDAAAHIYPSDLVKCNTSECVVEVFSVRVGNGEERSVPLFSREQVAEALSATLPPASAAIQPLTMGEIRVLMDKHGVHLYHIDTVAALIRDVELEHGRGVANPKARAALATKPQAEQEAAELPPLYMLAKLQMVMPLFQEARDALTAITEAQRKLHGISPSLDVRMDEAGTFSLDDWNAARGQKGGV